jgi:hypothetical protein
MGNRGSSSIFTVGWTKWGSMYSTLLSVCDNQVNKQEEGENKWQKEKL